MKKSTLKNFHIFSQKNFLTPRLKYFFYFLKENFFLYFSKWNFLAPSLKKLFIFQEGPFQAQKMKKLTPK